MSKPRGVRARPKVMEALAVTAQRLGRPLDQSASDQEFEHFVLAIQEKGLALGLSQAQLARWIGVSQAHISQNESGATPLSAASGRRTARELRIRIDPGAGPRRPQRKLARRARWALRAFDQAEIVTRNVAVKRMLEGGAFDGTVAELQRIGLERRCVFEVVER